MSIEGVAAVGLVCVCVVVVVAMVLRNLVALHITKPQVDGVMGMIAAMRKELEDTNSRLTALSNRTR